MFFPYVFPYAPETKENSITRIDLKQNSNSCPKQEIAQNKGKKIFGKRSHVKFKSLLLRQIGAGNLIACSDFLFIRPFLPKRRTSNGCPPFL